MTNTVPITKRKRAFSHPAWPVTLNTSVTVSSHLPHRRTKPQIRHTFVAMIFPKYYTAYIPECTMASLLGYLARFTCGVLGILEICPYVGPPSRGVYSHTDRDHSAHTEKGGTWFELIPLNERGFDFAILPGRFRFCLHSTGAFFRGEKNIGARLLVGKIRRTGGR